MATNRSQQPGKTRDEVRQLTAKGILPRTIALQLGISTQAVYQHLARIRRERPELEEVAS